MKSSDETFVTTLEEMKAVEMKVTSIREEAKKRAEEILKNARREVEETKLMVKDDIMEMKNRLIAEGKKETEREVDRILTDAKMESEKIKAKKADAKLLDLLREEVLKLE